MAGMHAGQLEAAALTSRMVELPELLAATPSMMRYVLNVVENGKGENEHLYFDNPPTCNM